MLYSISVCEGICKRDILLHTNIHTRLDVIGDDPGVLLVPTDIMTTYFEVEYESPSVLYPSFHPWDGEDST